MSLPGRPKGEQRRASRQQRGSSLVEVLVALLLSAIGMLGLAGTLAVSIGMAKLGEHRATATLLATDLGDRVRASAQPAREGAYDDTRPFDPSTAADDPEECAVPELCTSAQRVALELSAWQTRVRQGLPGGAGYVEYDSSTEHVDIWVAWLEHGAAPSPRSVHECPSLFAEADPAPRCIHLRVAL